MIALENKYNQETFKVLVDYVQPKFADLKSAFDWVRDWFAVLDFKPIDRCKSVSREKREVTFEYYLNMDSNALADTVLEEMERQDLRPALYEELLAFMQEYPDAQRDFPIVALGSVMLVDGIPYIACIDTDVDSLRVLDLHWFDGSPEIDGVMKRSWSDLGYRFLVVRK